MDWTTFPLSPGSSPGQAVRLTQWVWTTSCRNWASTMPGLRFPSGCRGVWWTHWTRCCRCSSRSWARPCRTRRRRKAGTKRNIDTTVIKAVHSVRSQRSHTLDDCITMATTVQHVCEAFPFYLLQPVNFQPSCLLWCMPPAALTEAFCTHVVSVYFEQSSKC